MAVKYRISYYDIKNNGWRVELSNLSYSGAIINLNTAQGQGCTISYTSSDDPLEPIHASTASFTVVNHDLGLIDLSELKNAGDKDWSVKVYRNNSLFWAGFLTPDGIQKPYASNPYDVQLSATDGLKLLTGPSFTTNNFPLPVGITQRSFISTIRDILFKSSMVGTPLPIRWVGYLKMVDPDDSSILKDAFTDTPYSFTGQGYKDLNGNQYSAYYILENYVRALGCRLYQAGGKWRIERIRDRLSGGSDWKEIDTAYDGTTVPVLTSGTEVRESIIGTDYIVDDGAYTINLPGLNKVTATYEQNNSENSLPNGTFDADPLSDFIWYGDDVDLEVDTVGSLSARAGNAAQLTYPAGSSNPSAYLTFGMFDGVGGTERRLPFDTYTMYKKISFGFTIMPQNGFPVDSTTGEIAWDTAPMKFKVSLNGVSPSGNKEYILNENGFWIPVPLLGSTFGYTSQTKVRDADGVSVNINTNFTGYPIVGDQITYYVPALTPLSVSCYCPATYSSDLLGFLNYAGQYLQDNSNGYITNWSVTTITPPGPGDPTGTYDLYIQTKYVTSVPPAVSDYKVDISLSNSNRDGSISLLPEESKIGDVIQINFDKFQGILLPDFSDFPDITHADLNIFFYVNKGQRYTLDDVYVTFDNNNEVYDYSYPDNKFTSSEDYALKISTSTNGFYTTNIMDSFDKSYDQSIYMDANLQPGTLTDLYAAMALRLRSKSLEMFEGSLIGGNFEYGYRYTIVGIDGKNFLPLSASYNTENQETQISVCEANNGNDSYERKFYGSNDKPLTNEIIN